MRKPARSNDCEPLFKSTRSDRSEREAPRAHGSLAENDAHIHTGVLGLTRLTAHAVHIGVIQQRIQLAAFFPFKTIRFMRFQGDGFFEAAVGVGKAWDREAKLGSRVRARSRSLKF